MLPSLSLYDTLTQQKKELSLKTPGCISLYVCGATVYDHCHIGHGRIKVVFDAWVRMARAMGYQVKYVMNITDIDDKIINKALSEDKSSEDVSEFFITQMREVDHSLGLISPDEEPRATAYIDEMVAMIECLISKGHAYTADGDVYFSVQSYPQYGQLSRQDVGHLQGERDLIATDKRHAADFVLWKSAKPGEPSWPSPWGQGRPGWHIECSAMSTKLLGEDFDIHGGGMDLKFPHHENEIAQACCAHNGGYARHWMHVGLVMMGQEKMSKSLGNTLLLKSLLSRVPAEVLRFMYLQTHYSKPLAFTENHMQQAEQAWRRLDRLVKDVALDDVDIGPVWDALADDFNTPQVIAQMFEWRRLAEQESTEDSRLDYLRRIKRSGHIMGLFQGQSESVVDENWVNDLIVQRQKAKSNKDYALADQIRDRLAEAGIRLEDTADGVKWHQL